MQSLLSASKPVSTCASQTRGAFDVEIIDDRPGLMILRAAGNPGIFARIRGRGSSLATNPSQREAWARADEHGHCRDSSGAIRVSVMPEIPEKDLEWTATRGSGAGGQARNKTSSAVQLWHIPTGLMVRCESERSQTQNRSTALTLLRARLFQSRSQLAAGDRSDARRAQLGSGMRGDKRRTIREQDGQVVDHITGKRWRFKEYTRGEW